MKALLLLVVVLACVWVWRKRTPPGSTKTSASTTPAPQDMVCCTRCGVHLPGNEALQGHHGIYCCQDHLSQSEP